MRGHALVILFFPITEHLPLCQAGCGGGPAARGQRHDREGEERHGSGQVRHMRCVRDTRLQQPINNQYKSCTKPQTEAPIRGNSVLINSFLKAMYPHIV